VLHCSLLGLIDAQQAVVCCVLQSILQDLNKNYDIIKQVTNSLMKFHQITCLSSLAIGDGSTASIDSRYSHQDVCFVSQLFTISCPHSFSFSLSYFELHYLTLLIAMFLIKKIEPGFLENLTEILATFLLQIPIKLITTRYGVGYALLVHVVMCLVVNVLVWRS